MTAIRYEIVGDGLSHFRTTWALRVDDLSKRAKLQTRRRAPGAVRRVGYLGCRHAPFPESAWFAGLRVGRGFCVRAGARAAVPPRGSAGRRWRPGTPGRKMLVLVLVLAALLLVGRTTGSCSPQKACDFLVRMHEQCIDGPYGPIPGASGCDPISLLCT